MLYDVMKLSSQRVLWNNPSVDGNTERPAVSTITGIFDILR